MLLLAKNTNTFIYDDGDNYYVLDNSETPARELYISKKDHKAFPVAAVTKYDMEAVAVDYLDNLAKELVESYEKK